MAIARYGPLVQSVVGSIGSVTFKGGASGGVLTRRARHCAPTSKSQVTHQAVFTAHSARYDTIGSIYQANWRTLGKTFQATNRVGVRRNMTARECFLSYLAGVDPDGSNPNRADTQPSSGVSPAPALDYCYFNASGLAYIVVFNPPAEGATERLWMSRYLNLGPRNSGGRRTYIGEAARTLTFINWDSAIRATGIQVLVGEQLRLEITWTTPSAPWPCATLTTIVDVGAG
jgi:hypothetical protein